MSARAGACLRTLRTALVPLALISSALAAQVEIGDLEEIPGVKQDGEMVAREVSGGTWHDGAMWIVDNEDDRHLLVMDGGRFTPRALPGLDVSDLEGISSDGTYLYVMAGGGLNKKGAVDARRFTLSRLTLKGGRIASGVVLDVLPWMKRLAKELDADLEKTRDTDGEKVEVIEDFKPEGLACTPDGRLLMGLRKPLVKGRSAVVELAGISEACDRKDPEHVQPKVIAKLDLDGGGISSLEWDPVAKTMLVLSIESGRTRTDFWTWPMGGKPEHQARLRGHKAEGVARVGKTGQVLILADDEDADGSKHGRYVLVEMGR